MSEYISGRYQYSVDIRFGSSDVADFFYEESISFVEWLSENYGIETTAPTFYNMEISFENFTSEIEEELEVWQDDGLPILDYNEAMNLVSFKIYTEAFGTFISEIAEDFNPESIDIQEIMSEDEEDDDYMNFGDDEYIADETPSNFEDDSYDDFDDY